MRLTRCLQIPYYTFKGCQLITLEQKTDLIKGVDEIDNDADGIHG